MDDDAVVVRREIGETGDANHSNFVVSGCHLSQRAETTAESPTRDARPKQ